MFNICLSILGGETENFGEGISSPNSSEINIAHECYSDVGFLSEKLPL